MVKRQHYEATCWGHDILIALSYEWPWVLSNMEPYTLVLIMENPSRALRPMIRLLGASVLQPLMGCLILHAVYEQFIYLQGTYN